MDGGACGGDEGEPESHSITPNTPERLLLASALPDDRVPSDGDIALAVQVYDSAARISPPFDCDSDAVKLFVGNIPKHLTATECTSFLEEAGMVIRVELNFYGRTKKSRGSALVWYKHRCDAISAIRTMHGQRRLALKTGAPGKPLTVRPFSREVVAAGSGVGLRGSPLGPGQPLDTVPNRHARSCAASSGMGPPPEPATTPAVPVATHGSSASSNGAGEPSATLYAQYRPSGIDSVLGCVDKQGCGGVQVDDEVGGSRGTIRFGWTQEGWVNQGATLAAALATVDELASWLLGWRHTSPAEHKAEGSCNPAVLMQRIAGIKADVQAGRDPNTPRPPAIAAGAGQPRGGHHAPFPVA